MERENRLGISARSVNSEENAIAYTGDTGVETSIVFSGVIRKAFLLDFLARGRGFRQALPAPFAAPGRPLKEGAVHLAIGFAAGRTTVDGQKGSGNGWLADLSAGASGHNRQRHVDH